MSDKTASVSIALAYVGPGDQSTHAPTLSIPALYDSESVGIIGIPDTTGASTFDVPFGTVEQATLVIVRNRTGQDLALAINGSDPLDSVPDGGVRVMAQGSLPAASQLAAVSLTSGGAQSGDGAIDFWVFGYPAPLG